MKKSITQYFEKLRELESKKRKLILIAAGAVVICLAAGSFMLYNRKPEVDSEYVNALLEKASELTSAKLNYTGMSEYKDTGIPVINKSDFIMVYKATARAGIDMKDVKVEIDNKKKIVNLRIPKAEVLDVKVNAASIKYFDEKFSLLNTNEKEDSNQAIDLAEKDAKKEVKDMGVLEMADEQAEALIKGLLREAVPDDYKFDIKRV
ncbi:MAG: DUF4230 domain-containing protein [Porphyromonadaceae bacterium]|nr:DUF4230 domain-containing protein [Porphyromonadaceae bacterium]